MHLRTTSILALFILLPPSFALPGAILVAHSCSEVLALYTIVDRPLKSPPLSCTKDILNIILAASYRNGISTDSSNSEKHAWGLENLRAKTNPILHTYFLLQKEVKPPVRARRLRSKLHPSQHHTLAQTPFQSEKTDADTETETSTSANKPHLNHNSGVIHIGHALIPDISIPLAFTISKDVCTPIASECGCLIDDLTAHILDEYPNGIALPRLPPQSSLALIPYPAVEPQDRESPPTPPVTISDTIRTKIQGREYRATMHLKVSGQWAGLELAGSHDLATRDASTSRDVNDQSRDIKDESLSSEINEINKKTQRDEFRLILGLLGKTAKTLWQDVLHQETGFGALNVKTRVGGVDVQADWVFYEVRRGEVTRCEV